MIIFKVIWNHPCLCWFTIFLSKTRLCKQIHVFNSLNYHNVPTLVPWTYVYLCCHACMNLCIYYLTIFYCDNFWLYTAIIWENAWSQTLKTHTDYRGSYYKGILWPGIQAGISYNEHIYEDRTVLSLWVLFIAYLSHSPICWPKTYRGLLGVYT